MTGKTPRISRRCPRLGSEVPFSYCEEAGEPGPCFKVFDCWWETFDVVAYMKARLSREAFEELVRKKPKPKVASLVDLVQQARERAEKD
ncbi:MAG: hypothetical protein JRI97_03115 [Deltaproteobacteria bacterium]|nr:hypothetical protein [Deltaproteobacteria bacterium]